LIRHLLGINHAK